MYSTCIFCSGRLGSNEVIETFPVGRRLAFDAWRGRLWAVCPRCGRWNLAPIEERWEAVETSEELFRATKLRVQSENIGLARLRDGTDLIRVGEALPGELAAWRYGEQLLRRHRRALLLGVGAVAAAGLGVVGLWTAGVGVVALWFGSNAVSDKIRQRRNRRTVHLLSPEDSPTGRRLLVQEAHIFGARFEADAHDSLLLRVPRRARRAGGLFLPPIHELPELTLRDDTARRVVSRVMAHVNHGGGSRDAVRAAVERLTASGDPEELVRTAARQGIELGDALAASPLVDIGGMILMERGGMRHPRGRRRGRRHRRRRQSLSRPELLALEMALNEESERRAMAGELAALRVAWREAEEIAAIADALPEERIALPDWLREGRAVESDSRGPSAGGGVVVEGTHGKHAPGSGGGVGPARLEELSD